MEYLFKSSEIFLMKISDLKVINIQIMRNLILLRYRQGEGGGCSWWGSQGQPPAPGQSE